MSEKVQAGGFAPNSSPEAGRLGRQLATWLKQETLLLLRQPVAIFFSLAFPLVVYLFIGVPYAEQRVLENARFIDMMFAGLIGTAVANLVVMGLPIYLAELRARRVDVRYRTLPLPAVVFVAALLLSMLVLAIFSMAVITGLVAARHGLLSGAANPLFWLLVLGMVAWLSALGFGLGSLPLGSRTIQALCAVVFFVMYFGSGAAIPIEGLPKAMRDVLAWNPLKQWFDVLVRIYIGAQPTLSMWWKLLMALPIALVSIGVGVRFWRRR